jgi:plastocyanin
MNQTTIVCGLTRLAIAAVVVFAAAPVLPVHAESIEGTVVIKKKLTKRRVTAEVPMYERGTAVELGADPVQDPLAFERARVAVYLEGRLSPPATGSEIAKPEIAKPEMVKMEQTNRRFSPEMVVIPVGAKVSFPNNDPIFHNVFSLSGPKTFDLGNYAKGDTRVVTFPAPGIVYVNCHLHPNMTATIVVTPNQWNTKADREGHFELADVPPGQYTLVAWHKASGFLRQMVTVEQGKDAHAEFLIPFDENGRVLESPKLETRRQE